MATQQPVFDEATQKELQQFLEGEQAKAKLQASIHEMTDRCWKTCMQSTSVSSKFSRTEAQCLENCVDRFLDTSMHFVKSIEQQQGGGGH